MTVKDAIEMLQRWNAPDFEVELFDGDSERLESLTGSLYDPTNRKIELCSDEQ